MKLKIQVSEASARLLSRHGVLTTGMVGAQVEFVFDEAWDGLQKTAVFRAGKLVKPVENINSTANIPVEVLQKASETLEVGVYGCSEDGELVIPTVYVKACTIYDGAEPSGSISEVIPVYIGLKNSIGNLANLYTSAKDSLVSAINQLWTTIRDEYLPIKGGKITGPINTRDVHIGGDVDPVTGEWSPDAGDGSSKVDVSGSMTVYGKTKHLASMDTRDVRVGGAYDAHGTWGPRNPHIVDHTPVGESVKNGLYISTMTIQEADSYHLILPEGSNYLYKMQITEGDRTRVFDVDQMPVIAAGTYGDEYWYDVGDGIGVIFSAKTRVDSSTKTFDDGFVGYKRLNFQKETEYVDDKPDCPYPAVGFHTYGPAEVKIWWVAGADSRFFAIKSEKRSGASRLDVSGNFVAHGNAEVLHTLKAHRLLVSETAEFSGGIVTNDDIKADGTVNVGNDLTVGGFISCGESLDMNGNDIKNAQTITVNGTSTLFGDVKIKNNANRDYTVKLRDVLDEALDHNFKSRVYVNEMNGSTFTERLQNAINRVDDGGVVCIPFGEYTLDSDVSVSNKSVKILGVGKEKPIINFASNDVHFGIIDSCTGLTIERCVVNCAWAYPAAIKFYTDGNCIADINIVDCQFNRTTRLIYVLIDGDYDINILRSEINGSNDYPNIVTRGLNNLTIVDSYLDGGNSFDNGAYGANIDTGAKNIRLENCHIVGYNNVIYPRTGVESISAYNCTVDVYGRPRLLDSGDEFKSITLVGGNLGMKIKSDESTTFSKVVTQADLEAALGDCVTDVAEMEGVLAMCIEDVAEIKDTLDSGINEVAALIGGNV